LRRSILLEHLHRLDDPHVAVDLPGEEAAVELSALLRRELANHRLLQIAVDIFHDLGELTGRPVRAHAGHVLMLALVSSRRLVVRNSVVRGNSVRTGVLRSLVTRVGARGVLGRIVLGDRPLLLLGLLPNLLA